jgi:monoamine oxidase
MRHLSDAAYDEGEEFGGPEVIFPNGYDQLLPALTGGVDIRLGTEITAIAHGPAGVTLTGANGQHSFDAAIITLPLGVLKAGRVTFDPPLGERKTQALDRLGMGLLNKVCLRFDRVFWDTDAEVIGYIGPRRARFSAWLNMAYFTGEPVLIAFNSGSAAEAIEAEPDSAVIAEAMDALRTIYG